MCCWCWFCGYYGWGGVGEEIGERSEVVYLDGPVYETRYVIVVRREGRVEWDAERHHCMGEADTREIGLGLQHIHKNQLSLSHTQ